MQDSLGIYSLLNNIPFKTAITAVANDDYHPCQNEARGILFSVFGNLYYPELKLYPEEQSGNRLFVSSTSEAIIKEPDLINRIQLYPNPAQEELYIENGNNGSYDLKIYNILGQLHSSSQILAETKNKISLNALPNGIYLVNLYEGNVLFKSNKLIIAH